MGGEGKLGEKAWWQRYPGLGTLFCSKPYRDTQAPSPSHSLRKLPFRDSFFPCNISFYSESHNSVLLKSIFLTR